jgi:molybdenum cofactor cytidylyltransferase
MISHQTGSKIATIILAAGESKRMKGIKQLLPWKNATLLTYAIRQAIHTETDAVFVVLGANKEAILSSTDTSETTIVTNKEWSAGMGSSIAAAVRHIRLNALDFDAVLIRLIDQPLLDINHYNNLINSYIITKNIVTSSYKSGAGVPAVFDHKYFNELMVLNTDKGAKEIIKKHKNKVSIIDSKGKTADLDDYQTYLSYFNLYGT